MHVCLTAQEGWKSLRRSTHYTLPCPFETQALVTLELLVIGGQRVSVILLSTELRLAACTGMLDILHGC